MNTLYPKQELTINDLPPLGDKWLFAGIDLAPNEMLETGLAVLDRNRTICRMDKLGTDEDIIRSITSLGTPGNLILALDVPKNLSIPGRFRQEEVKLHPLRINRPGLAGPTERYAARVWKLLPLLEELGILTFLYFNYIAKMRYCLSVPFRTRTSQGCRALQGAIKLNLGIQNMSSNLSPSSVLDAMIGAYAAWSIFMERDNPQPSSFRIYREQDRPQAKYLHLEPLSRVYANPR